MNEPRLIQTPSFSKINWTLEVLGRRADQYHELRSILQTVSLSDELTFVSTGEGIELSCDDPNLPTDESNLVCRAARLLQETIAGPRGARIHLTKRIPAAAGLGGGSSNAAITLLGLIRLWELEVQPRMLFELAGRLGADVPFFLLGGAAIGVGRGDEVYPMPDITGEYMLLVNAGITMPTRDVYARLPARPRGQMTDAHVPFSVEAIYRFLQNFDKRPPLKNDLEDVVFASHPLLAEVKDRLIRAGAIGVQMSGSGSTIFALFDDEATRSVAAKECATAGWWCRSVRAMSRIEYQQAIAFR